MRQALAILLVVISLTSAAALAQNRHNFILTGASPGGLWSLLGAGIHSAVAARYPGTVVTYQTSGGGLANVVLLSEGRAEIGIVHNVELHAALAGKAPFRRPHTNILAIAYLYNWAPMQWVMSKPFAERYGIETADDLIAAKAPVRFGVNTRGNMVQEINREILAAYGVDYGDVEAWGGQIVITGQNEMSDLMQNRRLDLIGNGVFAPDSRIVQTGSAVELTMLSLNEEVIRDVSQATGAGAYKIPAGTYEWLDRDIDTVALGAVLVASDALTEQLAYDLTKALVEDVDRIRRVHTAMRSLTPELMVSQRIIAYHPGALRYYREAGLVD